MDARKIEQGKLDSATMQLLLNQRESHVRQLMNFNVCAVIALIAFVAGCFVFRNELRLSHAMAQILFTVAAIGTTLGAWRYCVFHLDKLRATDELLCENCVDPRLKELNTVPFQFPVYPFLCISAFVLVAGALFAVKTDMGAVALVTFGIIGFFVLLAAVPDAPAEDADSKMKAELKNAGSGDRDSVSGAEPESASA